MAKALRFLHSAPVAKCYAQLWMKAPRADSGLRSRQNTLILWNRRVMRVGVALPHTNFIANATNISQLDSVRVHQPEFAGNANGFPTGACCVRPLLRQSPTAAAEWAKPTEIRPGTSVEAPGGASGCRTAVSDNFNTLTQKLRFGGTRATRLTGPCLLYTSPSPRDATLSRMPSSA